ncbi:hypothetical protein BD324DRAFT_1625 [Kockovaella imperatae]|uniref:Uncharacterized protein n=1 Tax=Kockovaella imperatae TaxID=4999 RepID=A0A1Y1UTE5_9TREE|nr:hypothetical protein BD324DRAFT_1625 [Kockovaella imperatae]ORX40465.1 hypothetical protein BD324DRAFT_1625 [Kockovaella imperatae]
MPPIPVTIHSRPSASKSVMGLQSNSSSHNRSLTTNRSAPKYYTITTTTTTTTNIFNLTPAQPPVIVLPTASSSGSSSTPSPILTTITIKSSSQRRKAKVYRPSTNVAVASLTPLLQPIVTRCLPLKPDVSPASSHTALPSPPPVTKRGTVGNYAFKKSYRPPPPPPLTHIIHPYSRRWDTTNDRSPNPSPREVAKAQRLELEKVKVREESAAIARAAAAAKRKRGKAKSTTKNSAPTSKSESPPDKTVALEDGVPVITNEPASSKGSPTLTAPTPSASTIPPRAGLKRTRSIGLGISTTAANSANGQMAVGSPLRSVTGPISPEDESRDAKRTRLGESESGRIFRRGSSGSPVVPTQGLPGPSLRRASANGLTSEAIAMRRAVSATTLAQQTVNGGQSMTRTGSVGSTSSLGEALASGRDRARREVTLPGRLRDYEMRAGTAT